MCQLFSFILGFKLIFLRNYRLDFFHRGLNETIYTDERDVDLEVIDCVHCVRSPILQISYNWLLILIQMEVHSFLLLHIYEVFLFHQGLNGQTFSSRGFLVLKSFDFLP